MQDDPYAGEIRRLNEAQTNYERMTPEGKQKVADEYNRLVTPYIEDDDAFLSSSLEDLLWVSAVETVENYANNMDEFPH